MNSSNASRLAFALAALLALASCGEGGGGPGDVRTGEPRAPEATSGPDGFLVFPNPQEQADGTLQTDTLAYAEAYYAAVDPGNARDTLAKWKAVNGFDSGTGTQVTVVFGDQRDLGYGRRMTGRRNPDGSLAFLVENYLVEAAAGYAYTRLNLEAAVARDARHLVFSNAIEVSPGPGGGPAFAKFFNFGPGPGARDLSVDLDGRGPKAMPGPCITCHGGRGDALAPPDPSGNRRMSLARHTASGALGDVDGKLHAFEVDAFDFPDTPGFTRADQQAAFKALNLMVLCSYPLPSPSSFPEDACRRPAVPGEWQAGAAAMLKSFYGGDGMPRASFSDDFLPASWQAAGQASFYRQVIVPACRNCHLVRGTSAQSDIDFATWEKFRQYAERTRYHVLDRGNMPLAKIIFDAFWNSTGPSLLATFLQGEGIAAREANGAVLAPGRPVADPGPDRVVGRGATRLSAAASLFAERFEWSLVSGPPGATLSGTDTAQPVFSATADGAWTLELVASRGASRSAPAQLRIVVKAALSPAPSAVRFADVKAALQSAGACTSCHSPGGAGTRPPVFFSDEDWNGNGVAGDAGDDAWLYEAVRGRANLADVAGSPLLRKPAGHHHAGGRLAGYDANAAPGDPSRDRYDLLLNWILAGAPR